MLFKGTHGDTRAFTDYLLAQLRSIFDACSTFSTSVCLCRRRRQAEVLVGRVQMTSSLGHVVDVASTTGTRSVTSTLTSSTSTPRPQEVLGRPAEVSSSCRRHQAAAVDAISHQPCLPVLASSSSRLPPR